jgi:hypothetical protein
MVAQIHAVPRAPDIRQPCIRGMRLTVRRVVEAVSIYPDRGPLKRQPRERPLTCHQAYS